MVKITMLQKDPEQNTMSVSIDAGKHKKDRTTFAFLMQKILNGLLTIMRRTAVSHPEARHDIYDMVNQACGMMLNAFDPEYDIAPDLTVDAIAAMEEYLIERKISELPVGERREAIAQATDALRKNTLAMRAMYSRIVNCFFCEIMPMEAPTTTIAIANCPHWPPKDPPSML